MIVIKITCLPYIFIIIINTLKEFGWRLKVLLSKLLEKICSGAKVVHYIEVQISGSGHRGGRRRSDRLIKYKLV